LKQEWQKSPAETTQTDSKNMVWFGEIEIKLDKFSNTTFTYRSFSYLFYGAQGEMLVIVKGQDHSE
jgi:hypothetical protein